MSHKVDYALRAMVVLAEVARDTPGVRTTGADLAARGQIPPRFLDDVLRLLRAAGLVRSVRGSGGGWQLARPAASITAADVMRAVDGPLASVRGVRPHELAAAGEPDYLVGLWVAVRSVIRSVLEDVTIADLAERELRPNVQALIDDAAAWQTRDLGR